jgi:hypothetical protein
MPLMETELANLTSRQLAARNLIRDSEAALNEYPNANVVQPRRPGEPNSFSASLPTPANFNTSPSLHSICKGPRPRRQRLPSDNSFERAPQSSVPTPLCSPREHLRKSTGVTRAEPVCSAVSRKPFITESLNRRLFLGSLSTCCVNGARTDAFVKTDNIHNK